MTLGVAAFLLGHARSNKGRRTAQKSKCQLEEAKDQDNLRLLG
jgi:hypothetical protein